MPAKKKKRVVKASSRKVCPKTHNGRRVIASKGRCYVKVPVKKVSPAAMARARAAKRAAAATARSEKRKPCVQGRFKALRAQGMSASTALKKAKSACGVSRGHRYGKSVGARKMVCPKRHSGKPVRYDRRAKRCYTTLKSGARRFVKKVRA